jgi:plasmid stability protein
MATLTIRQLDDALVRKIKQRAVEAGRSMEEEIRNLLDRTYGTSEQMKRQRAFVKRQLARLDRGEMPSSDTDSAELIRQMREERDTQLMEAIEGPRDGRR